MPDETLRRLAFAEEFEGDSLATERWLPLYLPHWSRPDLAAPRYEISGGCLTLRIDPDQLPWCPEYDGAVKCSCLQTGHYAGPVGSAFGQHRFRDGLIVRSEVPHRRLYVRRYARIEMRAKADIGPANLVSLYMLGYEEQPEQSGEITVMEIFGTGCGPNATQLGYGIKPIRDPRLRPEFHADPLPFDLSDWHTYAVDWSASGIGFYLDGALLHRSAQSPDSPMQLMLAIYELPAPSAAPHPRPATFTIDYLHAWETG